MRPSHDTPTIAKGDIDLNVASFVPHLRAEKLSARQMAAFLAEQGMPAAVARLRREHMKSFIAGLLERRKPATANNRFRGLQQFFKWPVDEGEITTSSVERMKSPRVPEQPVPVLGNDDLRALLATCEHGRNFTDRRDHAILRVFIDTGARLAELAGLRFEPGDELNNDVDLDQSILRVMG